jgi:hypothetical protein
MVPVVEPGNRADRTEDEKVRPEVVAFDVREKAAMHGVVTDNKKPVVTIADHRNSDQHRPPCWVNRYQSNRRQNPSPADNDVNHCTPMPEST